MFVKCSGFKSHEFCTSVNYHFIHIPSSFIVWRVATDFLWELAGRQANATMSGAQFWMFCHLCCCLNQCWGGRHHLDTYWFYHQAFIGLRHYKRIFREGHALTVKHQHLTRLEAWRNHKTLPHLFLCPAANPPPPLRPSSFTADGQWI